MKKQPDLYYQDFGLFIRFIPNTDKGVEVWREMATHESTCTFLAMHKSSILKQLKDAGVSYGKIKKERLTEEDASMLMDELEDIRKDYKQ